MQLLLPRITAFLTLGLVTVNGALLGDWSFCTKNSQCADNCCSKELSGDGKYKCTPGGTTSKCTGTSKLGDWEFCSLNSNCKNSCCSKQYSGDGQYKCTPGGTLSQCTGIKGGPSPTPTPPTPIPPTPTPGTTSISGYYDQTWSGWSGPSGANLGVAFSGWNDVATALSDSTGVIGSLQGTKFLSIGGGDASGRWTAAIINKLNSYMQTIKNTGYAGVCYDIEEGDAGLASAFTSSFQAAKSAGLQVLVTVSHQASYGLSDGAAVMNAVFASSNVDYISPQLYVSGKETANDFGLNKDGTNGQITWNSYASAKGKVIPSIAHPSLYSSAKTTFAGYGVTTYGYVAWSA